MLTIVTLTPARIVARATKSPSELSLLGQQRRFAISGMARPPASLLFQYRLASGVRSRDLTQARDPTSGVSKSSDRRPPSERETAKSGPFGSGNGGSSQSTCSASTAFSRFSLAASAAHAGVLACSCGVTGSELLELLESGALPNRRSHCARSPGRAASSARHAFMPRRTLAAWPSAHPQPMNPVLVSCVTLS